MNKDQRGYWLPLLVKRDGYACSNCGKIIGDKYKGKRGNELVIKSLLIHHRNGYDWDNRLINLALLCRACNTLKKFHNKILHTQRDLTPEMKIKVQREPVFRTWLSNLIQQNNFHYGYDKIIDSSAYQFDISTVTVKRWLRPLMSELGPFYLTQIGMMGEWHIALKGKKFGLEDDHNNEQALIDTVDQP